ncbi:MAG: tRNA (N6-isopentenyl adenosine(37)-C2)-methylthiotransferase MiaB [Actinomycetes bacterium]|jgi:tRNA-2-methylthio-N6-dimethylallyladenosine synthase|nr:tRNA (N6-isopentenyl adenosine(37)-C2)-methylthiotransferase MiaB [Actinomycetes bacterium]
MSEPVSITNNPFAGALYCVRCFGCQMNKHDAEVIAGLLNGLGMTATDDTADAAVIVFLTCCVREGAEERLRGQVASLKQLKTADDGSWLPADDAPLVAVGGCIGQRDGAELLKLLPHTDVVFGTQNIQRLPALLHDAHARRSARTSGERYTDSATVETVEASDAFAADLPTVRKHPWHAWLPITQGCNNFCSYCIVPYVRGREKSRPLERIVEQAETLVADGVREITLLGQNVNSYGRDRYGTPRFAEALAAVAATGVERLGFATSHPKDLLDETIAVMGRTPQILRYLHLPVQSGSDRVLQAMNRHYTGADYRRLVCKLRAAVPDIALSTDLIVGFPGETERDFADTLQLVREVEFDQAFTFLFSPRAKTPAATMPDQVPADVAQERFERLVDAVQAGARAGNERLVGTRQDVLVEGASKRDAQVLVGRDRHYKVCHFPLPAGNTAADWQGRTVAVRVAAAHTWYLDVEPSAPGAGAATHDPATGE